MVLIVGRYKDSGRWNFKATRPTREGFEVVDLNETQRERIPQYSHYLEKATSSRVSHPRFSGYHVKGYLEGMPGGNIEYGMCQALHCEETIIAISHATRRGRMSIRRGETLALIAGAPGNPATPCGNCRDFLLDEFGTDFEVVSGAPKGGLALVTKFEDYLFDDFEEIDFKKLNDIDLDRILLEGKRLEDIPYFNGEVHPERRYFAIIKAEGNLKMYIGASEGFVDYHTNYALRDALRAMRRDGQFLPKRVVILRESESDTPPHVMYKDRQHLLERIDRGINLLGFHHEYDIPVNLLNVHPKDSSVVAAWQTSAREWLPMPFTPANLGPELNAMLKSHDESKRKLFEEE